MGIQLNELVSWVRGRKIFATLLVIVTLGIGIMIGTLISGRAMATRDQSVSGAALLAVPDPVVLSNGFSRISKKGEPATVNISTTQIMEKSKAGGGAGPGKRSQDDPFHDFFD